MYNYQSSPEFFQKNAEILKALAHPVRLCIVKRLCHDGPTNVTDMHNCLEQPQSTISQHIAKLRSVGIIKGERQGVEIIYSISNNEVKRIIDILFR